MLLLIVSIRRSFVYSGYVSIHLMLLLIEYFRPSLMSNASFNTSHVTINQIIFKNIYEIARFNTSHVTINRRKMMLLGFMFIGFNTSHVTINHKGVCYPCILNWFQYISCYY